VSNGVYRPLPAVRAAAAGLALFLTPPALAVPAPTVLTAATHYRPRFEPQQWLTPQAAFLTPRALAVPAPVVITAATHYRPRFEPQQWLLPQAVYLTPRALAVPAIPPQNWVASYRTPTDYRQWPVPQAAYLTPRALAVPAPVLSSAATHQRPDIEPLQGKLSTIVFGPVVTAYVPPPAALTLAYLRDAPEQQQWLLPIAPYLTPFALAVPAPTLSPAATHQRPDIEPQQWPLPQAGLLTPFALAVPAPAVPQWATHQRFRSEQQQWLAPQAAYLTPYALEVPALPAPQWAVQQRYRAEQQQALPPQAAYLTPFALGLGAPPVPQAATHARTRFEPQQWLVPQAGFVTPVALAVPAPSISSAAYTRYRAEVQQWAAPAVYPTVTTQPPPAVIPLAHDRPRQAQPASLSLQATYLTPFALPVPAATVSLAAYVRPAGWSPLPAAPAIYTTPVASFTFAPQLPRLVSGRTETPQVTAGIAAWATIAPADVPAWLAPPRAAYGRVVPAVVPSNIGLAAIDASIPTFVFAAPRQDGAYDRPAPRLLQLFVRGVPTDPPYVFPGPTLPWVGHWPERFASASTMTMTAVTAAPDNGFKDPRYRNIAAAQAYATIAEPRSYDHAGTADYANDQDAPDYVNHGRGRHYGNKA
jgi:hypothetical protein